MIRPIPFALFLPMLVSSCSTPDSGGDLTIGATISAEQLQSHIAALASDEFLGRAPFSMGEAKTLEYLESEYKRIGLQPGNGDSYLQDVPMVEISTRIPQEIELSTSAETITLSYGDDFVSFSQWLDPNVSIEQSELVFAGYGIIAPEYDWNDYEGLNVEGKTVMVLVNDPGFRSGDSTLFKGETMTYYGRWTYKFEEAARQGATGVFVIHNTMPAGYPWQVVRNSWDGSGLYLRSSDENRSRCPMEGWVTTDAAEKIFSASTSDFSDYKIRSLQKGFKAIPTGFSYSMLMTNTWKEDISRNVIGVSPGDVRPDEYVIYTAHWDHLGVGVPNNGDSIYNGALDNASGIASMLEIAEAFRDIGSHERSVVFLAVTAEEQGLLGSAYYVENPIFPLTKTVANINIDGLYYHGRLKDLTIVGYGQSELEDYAEQAATAQDRYILPDQESGKGYFFRSDHFNFAKVGVPALYAAGDHELREGGVEKMKELKHKYNTERYHLPADEIDESWDYTGMVEDTQLLLEVGLRLSNDSRWPSWKDGSEFKAIRDSYMDN